MTVLQAMRKLPGGVHPAEKKTLSNSTPIETAPIPNLLVIPCQQHIGEGAKPIVAVGDIVLKGQMIANADGFISVPVHAPTSGKIIAIEKKPIPHPSGLDDLCIVLKPDQKDTWIERNPSPDYQLLEKNAVINIIQQSGVAGLGGAGFPTAIKVSPRPHMLIDTLILNGVECEPYITSDDRLMRERADDIIGGMDILIYLLNPKQCLLGVEDNKPEAIHALQQALAKKSRQVPCHIVEIPSRYPSGGEKQLIYLATGKEVPSHGIPADLGIVCQNVGTASAIFRAVVHGEPTLSRITTITGEAVRKPGNYDVLIGTPINELLRFCGVEQKQLSRLIMGGPMMGFSLKTETAPIIKTTNCIIAATQRELPPPPPEQACIRCGMCDKACPMHLLPQQLFWYSKAKDHDTLRSYNLFDCIECGACSYVCPSNIPLVQYYRAAKGDIKKQELEQVKSDRARKRFEQHQERIAKQKAEREAKLAARTKARSQSASDQDNKTSEIQAAVERVKQKKYQESDNK